VVKLKERNAYNVLGDKDEEKEKAVCVSYYSKYDFIIRGYFDYDYRIAGLQENIQSEAL